MDWMINTPFFTKERGFLLIEASYFLSMSYAAISILY